MDTPEPTIEDGNATQTIIGLSFDEVLLAREFLSAMTRISGHGQIELRDAVLVVKDADGKVKVTETVDLEVGRSAMSGAVWTGLLGLVLGGPIGWAVGLGVGAGAGALRAKIVDLGIPDEWVEWFRMSVATHTASVVIMGEIIDEDAFLTEVRRFAGGHLVYANLPADTLERLETALER